VTFGPFSFYDEASGSWKPLNSTNWANSGIDAGASEPSSRTAGETGGGLPALTAENYWAAYANQDSWAQRSPAALANAVYGNLAAQAEMYRNGADLFDYGVMVSIAAPPLVVAGAPAFLATAKGIAWFNSLPPTMKIWMASTAIRLATFGDLKGPALRPDGRSAGLQIVIEMVDTVKKKGAGTPPTK
jgi:hypothetical protein